MEFSLVVDLEELGELRDRFPEAIQRFKDAVAVELRIKAPQLIELMLGQYQTGALASSFDVGVTGRGVEMSVGSGIPYAGDVFFGADPHTIRPVKAQALHWTRAGFDFFAKKVEHPGQAARKDILEALRGLARRVALNNVQNLMAELYAIGS